MTFLKKIFVALFLLSSTLASAQFNFSVSGGYAWGVNKLRAEGLTGDNNNPDYTLTFKKIGFGTGFCPNFRLGYTFSNKFDIGLSLSYLKSNNQILYQYNTEASPFYRFQDAKASTVFLGIETKYYFSNRIYTGVCLVTNIHQNISGNSDMNLDFETSETSIRKNYVETTKLSLGSKFLIGYNYLLNDHFSVFGEVCYTIMNTTTEKGNYTSVITDGIETIDTYNTDQIYWEYYEEIQYGTIFEPNEPEKRLLEARNTMSFSSIGFQIGIKYSL